MGVFAVTPVEVAIDASAARLVIRIVGVIQAESFERGKVGFDGVEPTGIGGCRD